MDRDIPRPVEQAALVISDEALDQIYDAVEATLARGLERIVMRFASRTLSRHLKT